MRREFVIDANVLFGAFISGKEIYPLPVSWGIMQTRGSWSGRPPRSSRTYLLGRVANPDLDISGEETRKMEEIVKRRQIAEELGFSHREYVDVCSSYNDKRSVVQRLRRQS